MQRQKNSVQSRPAYELYGTLTQVEITSQYGLNVTRVGVTIHRLVELNHAAEFVAAVVVSVGQYELRVVLCGHG